MDCCLFLKVAVESAMNSIVLTLRKNMHTEEADTLVFDRLDQVPKFVHEGLVETSLIGLRSKVAIKADKFSFILGDRTNSYGRIYRQ